jgi:putative ABC transport system permease protein
MHFSDSISSSVKSIFSHFFRSLLTLFGISIGVFAVVTMFSSVYGLKNLIQSRMEGMGWNNSLMLVPGAQDSGRSSFRHGRMRFRRTQRVARPISLEDFHYLSEHISYKYNYGMLEKWDFLYFNEKIHNVRVRATNEDFFVSQTFPLKSGRYFSAFEENTDAKVCVIGYHFAEDYFANENPIDKIITVGAHRYKIIGVLDEDQLNENGFQFNPWGRRWDLRAIYIPLTTGAKYLRTDRSLDYIYFQAGNPDIYAQMKIDVNQTMLMLHKMSKDFSFNDIGPEMLKITKEIDEMMDKWNITLFAIASISLIVGGIGLFSTLLISISERMMEIGIRKSIGAKERDIFVLFIAEAVILAVFAALFGIAASSGIIVTVSKFTSFDFPVPMQGIVLGFGFSLLIGLLSGLYPAIKASKIDPIKAIYYQD